MIELSQRLKRRSGRRSAALVLAIVVAVGTLAACSSNSSESRGNANEFVARTVDPGKPVSDQEIPLVTIGVAGQINTFDPSQNGGTGGLYVNTLGLESLLRIDSEGELSPWLATKFEQTSETTYEYTLREGVKFWDGAELTSEDVKYSWDHERASGSRSASYFSSVEKVEALERYLVRVTLKYPDASWKFTPALFRAVIFQKEFAEQHKDKFGQPGTLLVATGPWKFDSLSPTTGVTLSAFDGYWGGAPPIEKVSVKSFADDNAMALALRAGEIDLTPIVGAPKAFNAAVGSDVTTTATTCATALFSMPTQTAPWDDIHVRRAVAHAINKEDIVAATQGRAAGPLDTLISPILLKSLGSEDEIQAALDTIPYYPHDLDKAKAELAKSKVPNGFEDTLTLDSIYGEVAQVIAAQVKEIGIDLKINAVLDTEYISLVTGPADERPVTFTESGACKPDPSWDNLFLGSDNLAPGALNFSNWAPKDVDVLITEGLSTQEPKQRLKVYTELLDRLGEDVPYIPIYAEGNTYASMKYAIADYGSYWANSPWLLNLVPK